LEIILEHQIEIGIIWWLEINQKATVLIFIDFTCRENGF